MISKNQWRFDNAASKLEFIGLSTDTKPTANVPNASAFYEMDTKKFFLFDEENGKWLEQ